MSHLKTFADINEALKVYIPSAQKQSSAYTLERMQKVMEYLGHPQHKYKVIHIAGTSGKTSTAYYISSMLTACGLKVGLTVSPHIDQINERVQINLEPLPEKEFGAQLERFLKLVEGSGVRPTYFEMLVAFAYWYFAEAKVDYAVIETGLGGLLDGTNVVTLANKVAVLTDIGLDHTEVLGQSLPEIAAQKAGIIHSDNAVFMYEQTPEVMEVFREVAQQCHADMHEIQPARQGQAPQELPLFQRRNWHLARAVYEFVAMRDELQLLSSNDLKETSKTYIPARMETWRLKDKILIIDGAHNAQKLSTLFKSITAKYPKQEMAILLSLKHTKGARARTSAAVVAKHASWLGLTSFTGSQDTPYESVEPAKVAEYCHVIGYDSWEIIDNPEQAFLQLMKRPEPILLVTGSFYLLNHIRPLIRRTIKA